MNDAFIFSHAFRDFSRLKRLAGWFFVALAMFGMAKGFMSLNDIEPAKAYSLLSALLVFRILPLASAILSTAVISQEIEQKTIVYLLTRPIDRYRLLLFRSLASMLVVMIVTVFSWAAVGIATFGMGFISNPYALRDLVAIAAGAVAYGSLFVFVSLLFNRSMIFNLIFAFAWETSIPSMPGNMSLLSISTYLNSVAQRAPTETGPNGGAALGNLANAIGSSSVSPGIAWLVLILLSGVCLLAGMWWFTKFEFVPREDAG